MALDLGRWWKYAQAKLSGAVASGNQELDRLEAEREAEVADRPWLAAEAEAPTLDEARARIEWEAHQAAQGTTPRPEQSEDTAPAVSSTATGGPEVGAVPGAEDHEVAAARLELERQARASKERLDAIREELGVEPPAEGG